MRALLVDLHIPGNGFKRCAVEGCKSRAAFNLPGEPPLVCSNHKRYPMVLRHTQGALATPRAL